MSRIVVVSVSGPEPNAETFSVHSVDITPRVPSAICASCGRKGTVAYVAFGSPPNEIRRYCRRCWPAAGRAEEEHRGLLSPHQASDHRRLACGFATR